MSLTKRLLLACASLLGSLLLAEGGYRAVRWAKGTPYSSTETATELQRLTDPNRPFVPGRPEGTPYDGAVLHPYVGAEDHHDTGDVLAFFRRGVPEDVYTVVIVGGSVAAAWATVAPKLLKQGLEADPRFEGKRVRVLNYAHHSYKQPQQLNRVAYLISLGYRPDAVINLDGFNETALALASSPRGVHPVYPSMPVWGVHTRSLETLHPEDLEVLGQLWQLREETRLENQLLRRFNLHWSSLVGTFLINRANARSRAGVALQQRFGVGKGPGKANQKMKRQVGGPVFDPKVEAVLHHAVRNWLESSLSLHALCEARGIAYLHVLQPSRFDPGSKPLSPEERALPEPPFGWRLGPERGYPLLRESSKQLRAAGVAFHDAGQVFSETEERLYNDACHFRALGSRLLSVEIAEVFLESME